MKKVMVSLIMATAISTASAQSPKNTDIIVQGAMRHVMQEGKLEAQIKLDTISNKKHLFGIGPLAFLKGEILIIDGRSYISKVAADGSVVVEETFDAGAPFLVYTHQAKWKEIVLPAEIQSIAQLDSYLDSISTNRPRPFVFMLKGNFQDIHYHIQNLPDGTIVKSPKDAHQGQGKYALQSVSGTIVGFFSTTHQRIFTHHDTYTHLHFIDDLKTHMGHIDELTFGNGAITLYLPD